MPTRPAGLAANQASLAALTDPDWCQTLIVDREGRGCAWANRNLANCADRLIGDYIWVLDDDDVCVRRELVEELKAISVMFAADVVVVRMDHGPELGTLPRAGWGRRAEVAEGDIGVSALICRREVWQKHAGSWGERYAGDFDFAAAVLGDKRLLVYWHDVVASAISRQSAGAGE